MMQQDWFPELQQQARQAVYDALVTGQLRQFTTCQRCRQVKHTLAHHYKGYAPENWLEVQWLCPTCHGLTHSRLNHGADERLSNHELEQMLDPINALPYGQRKWYK